MQTRTRILFSSLLLLLGTLFLVPSSAPVHGQFTGTVCIIPSGSTTCPSSPLAIGGTVGTQLRVSIFMQGSDATNGFEVILLADHTVLKPASVDLTGTVLIAPQSIIVECLQGVLIRGSVCNAADSIDTIEFTVAGAPGQLTATPTTGLLFTAIYNVTAASSGTPIGYQSSSSCTPSSVTGTQTCIQIVNGSPTPDPENAQTAVFTTSDFTISASPNTLTIARNSQGTSTIALTSVSGFSGTVTLSTNISPASKAPTTSLSTSSITLSSGGTGSAVLTVSAGRHTALGSYTVTVTGTSGTISNSVTVTVTVTR